MPKNKYKWVNPEDLDENARIVIGLFVAAMEISQTGIRISHKRNDAIFFQYYGILDPYRLATFIKTADDCHVEIDAKAPRFFDIRVFYSDWMKSNQIPHNQKILKRSIQGIDVDRSIQVRINA